MNFYMPTKVYHEREAVENHRGEMALLGKRALIVTGRHSSRENGALQDVTEALEQTNTAYLLYDKVGENPTVESVMEAALLGRREGADFVIGVGGGSPMDAAKAIALMIQNRDSSEEVLYQAVSLRALPVVAVPTTCGTGSEVTPYAILTRHDNPPRLFICLPDCRSLIGSLLHVVPPLRFAGSVFRIAVRSRNHQPNLVPSHLCHKKSSCMHGSAGAIPDAPAPRMPLCFLCHHPDCRDDRPLIGLPVRVVCPYLGKPRHLEAVLCKLRKGRYQA